MNRGIFQLIGFALVPLFLSLQPASAYPGVTSVAPGAGQGSETLGTQPIQAFGLAFEQNVGQFPAGARFRVRGMPGPVWLVDDGLWIVVSAASNAEGIPQVRGNRPLTTGADRHARSERGASKRVNLNLSFLGANSRASAEAFGRTDTMMNYYIGNAPEGWIAGAPVWSGVRYRDLYPGIDLEIGDAGGRWNWRLLVRDPDVPGMREALHGVRLRVEGADALAVDGNNLRLTTAIGDVSLPLLQAATARTQHSTIEPLSPTDAPVITGNEVRGPVAERNQGTVSGIVRGGDVLGRSPAQAYRPLALANQRATDVGVAGAADLVLSTYLGADGDDEGRAVAVGSDGAVYVTGWTMSSGFPTTPGLDTTLGGGADAFVTKLGPDGSLVYSTFLGGTYQNAGWPSLIAESGNAIAVDSEGGVYLTGHTYSSDFPTTANAFDTTFNGDSVCSGVSPPVSCSDAFFARLAGSGALDYGTFLGGSHATVGDVVFGGNDEGTGIAVDGQGNVYITGWTTSGDFPTTPGAYDRVFADVDVGLNDDVFVAKLSPAGNGSNDLLYGTYVGAGYEERGYDIAVDASGAVYVVGYSAGDFPTTPGAFDRSLADGDRDAFVFKMNPGGQGAADLLYSTYLGGSEWDRGYGIALDGSGSVYVTGHTGSSDFPTTSGAFDRSCGTDGNCNATAFGSPGDAFVSKLNLAGEGPGDLVYSTFLGGNYFENWNGGDIAVDEIGDVYVTGDTWSSQGFPTTPGAFDASFNGFYDAFVARLRPLGHGASDLLYSTELGGTQRDAAGGIALAGVGTVFVAGRTNSSNFPTTSGAYDQTYGGGTCGSYPCNDVFVAKLSLQPTQYVQKAAAPPGASLAPGDVLSYTVSVVVQSDQAMGFYDRVPTYTTYISGSLNAPVGVIYDSTTNAITGSVSLSGGVPVTITYGVRADAPSAVGSLARILNQACIYPAGGVLATCAWSNEVSNYASGWRIYLPVIKTSSQ
ncbi:MAG: SBBP repeat-containing protein [Chloroflexi bacterium]|nr:SBBP repeat-containing protein [Chloroflexota bacterium]